MQDWAWWLSKVSLVLNLIDPGITSHRPEWMSCFHCLTSGLRCLMEAIPQTGRSQTQALVPGLAGSVCHVSVSLSCENGDAWTTVIISLPVLHLILMVTVEATRTVKFSNISLRQMSLNFVFCYAFWGKRFGTAVIEFSSQGPFTPVLPGHAVEGWEYAAFHSRQSFHLLISLISSLLSGWRCAN